LNAARWIQSMTIGKQLPDISVHLACYGFYRQELSADFDIGLKRESWPILQTRWKAFLRETEM
jgi:hypothetical protein